MAKREIKGKPETHWGYIEGFYWRLMGWNDRGAIVDHLGRLGADSYLYAPKEDPLHRRDWRIPYGTRWQVEWAKFAERAALGGVKAIPGMAPGLSFDYLDEDDYRILLMKLETFRDLGSGTLALLMDDIPPALPENCEGKFSTLGEAHGQLLTRLLKDLNVGKKSCRLWFCPTVYTDQFATAPAAKVSKGSKSGKSGKPVSAAKDPYLLDLARTMP